MWREHINHDHIHKLHMPDDGRQCFWKRGCGQSWTPVFCSLRCRIRVELYEFLIRFPQILDIVDDIDMYETSPRSVKSSPHNAMFTITDPMTLLQHPLIQFTAYCLSSYITHWYISFPFCHCYNKLLYHLLHII
jgi:hypothetical protein